MEKNHQVVFKAQNVVELVETAMPEIGDDDVLIRTDVSQISTGTELTNLEANVGDDSIWKSRIKYPIYPGYSNVGTIINTGKNGDPSWIGKKVFAMAKHVKYYKVTAEGVRTLEDQWGSICGFVPDNVSSEEAAFAGITDVASGAVRVSDIRLGDTVVVFGAGLIGQMTAIFAKLRGALRIFVADVSGTRLDFLPDDPCFIKVNTKNADIVDTIKKNNNGQLARVVFEATSVPSLIEAEIRCIGNGVNGQLVIVSSPKGKSNIDFDGLCVSKGISITGAGCMWVHPSPGNSRDPWTMPRDKRYFIELLERKLFPAKQMITHRANYKDAPEMYRMLMDDRTNAMAVNLYWEDNV